MLSKQSKLMTERQRLTPIEHIEGYVGFGFDAADDLVTGRKDRDAVLAVEITPAEYVLLHAKVQAIQDTTRHLPETDFRKTASIRQGQRLHWLLQDQVLMQTHRIDRSERWRFYRSVEVVFR